MPEFITKCPHCSGKIKFNDQWIGVTVKCPICSKYFPLLATKVSPLNLTNEDLSNTKSLKIICVVFIIVTILMVTLIVSCILMLQHIYKSETLSRDSSKQNTLSYSNENEKISIEVAASFGYSTDSYYKFPNEYRVYANNNLVATKHSRLTFENFKVKVERNARIRVEILVKNGFGGIESVYEGPAEWLQKDVFARYSGEKINIKCR